MNELVANAELCISKAIESYERDDIKKAIHFLQKSLRIHRTDKAAELLSEYVSIDDGLIKPKRQAPTRPQLKAEEAKTEIKTENILDKTFQNDIERMNFYVKM